MNSQLGDIFAIPESVQTHRGGTDMNKPIVGVTCATAVLSLSIVAAQTGNTGSQPQSQISTQQEMTLNGCVARGTGTGAQGATFMLNNAQAAAAGASLADRPQRTPVCRLVGRPIPPAQPAPRRPVRERPAGRSPRRRRALRTRRLARRHQAGPRRRRMPPSAPVATPVCRRTRWWRERTRISRTMLGSGSRCVDA